MIDPDGRQHLADTPLESLSSRRRPARRGVAGRLAATRPGASRRAVILQLIACIGERVRPASPALDHPARDRWERLRIDELQQQLEEIRDRREGWDDGP